MFTPFSLGRILVLFLISLTLSACLDRQEFHYSKVPVKHNLAQKQLTAGVGIRDITPAPGIPRSGYALWSTTGEGFRTRLKARAYYLKDKDGQSFAMIQTDLMAGSRILFTRVVELVAEKTDIHHGNLTITATHTHSSPGQYFGSEMYNKHASHRQGFDPDYFEFLANQLADALIEAYDHQVDAKLATGRKAIWGLSRNRAIEPYRQNKNQQAITNSESEVFHAINPYLYMVRIDGKTPAGDYQPMGAFLSFSIHGTSIPRHDPFFSADLWAYLQGDLKNKIEKKFKPTGKLIIGGFEGTHGDMAPAMPYNQSGYIWSRNVGSAIAKQAYELYEQLTAELDTQADFKIASRYIKMREQAEINGISICDKASIGATLTSAPFEHESPFFGWMPYFKNGSKSWFFNEGCQGNKSILGGEFLQSLIEPKENFPNDILFQIVQLGDLVIAPLPFELTAETGARIERAIQSSYQTAELTPPHVMVTSLANGYTGYITTPEEYGEQNYESGHTIYGQYSQPYVTEHLRLLANDLLAEKTQQLFELPEHWQFDFSIKHFISPAKTNSLAIRKVMRQPELKLAEVNQEAYWSFDWIDQPPALINLHQPLLSIQTGVKDGRGKINWQPLQKEGLAIDDQGYDMAIQLIDTKEENDKQTQGLYRAYWYNPSFAGPDQWYRFAVQARGKDSTFYSPAFN
jgi:neutral ceramidase